MKIARIVFNSSDLRQLNITKEIWQEKLAVDVSKLEELAVRNTLINVLNFCGKGTSMIHCDEFQSLKVLDLRHNEMRYVPENSASKNVEEMYLSREYIQFGH